MREMLITVVTPTKNEYGNIEKLTHEIKKTFETLKINYEHIIIDNNSNAVPETCLRRPPETRPTATYR